MLTVIAKVKGYQSLYFTTGDGLVSMYSSVLLISGCSKPRNLGTCFIKNSNLLLFFLVSVSSNGGERGEGGGGGGWGRSKSANIILILLYCFILFLIYSKLELLTKFPASNQEKYYII